MTGCPACTRPLPVPDADRSHDGDACAYCGRRLPTCCLYCGGDHAERDCPDAPGRSDS